MNKNTPHVVFNYSIKKDIENMEIGLRTVRNGRSPDPVLKSVIEIYGEAPSKKEIEEFILQYWENKEEIKKIILKQLQEYWDDIEKKFFTHLADKMQLNSFDKIEEIMGFLSTRHGSGYDVENLWFAVSSNNGTLRNILTSMHEIMHIFFHKYWWKFCKEKNIPEKNIWDIKEATTVLLNLWFKNQITHTDWGYEEHIRLRRNIKKWFLESKNFQIVLEKACDYIKTHPKESPEWIA